MAELPSSRKRVGLDGWTAMSGDSRRRDRPICLDRPERLFSPRFTMISQLNRTMEFLTALQSTEGGDCADAELATTKSDIARIRIGCPRSEPRSRLGAISRSIRAAIPIHYCPLSSVAHHSLTVQSRRYPPCSGGEVTGDNQAEPRVSACAIQNIDETVKFWPGGRSLNGAVGNAHYSLPWRLQLLSALEPFCFCQGQNL
jgi:hypothetical protein